MTIHRAAIAAATIALLGFVAGCDKGSGSGSAGSTTPAAQPAAAATTAAAAKKGDPEPTIAPGARKPFEALVFRNTGEVNKTGWPKYDVYNQSDKKVKYASIYGFAYDKAGKLVTRTDTPLSWNENSGLGPGKKADWAIEIDSWGKAQVGAGAAKFELCYDSVKFDDDKIINDNSRCTPKRPVGGVK